MKFTRFKFFEKKQKLLLKYNREYPIFSSWLFVTRYQFLLLCCSVPLVLLMSELVTYYGYNVVNYAAVVFSVISTKFFGHGNYISVLMVPKTIMIFKIFVFIIFYMVGFLAILFSVFISHRCFLSNYSSKKYIICRDGTVKSDLQFLSTWLLIGLPFHIFFMLIGFNGKAFTIISNWIVLNMVFYSLLHIKWCGYSLRKRSRILKS